ncbi:MAG: GNAT family N-acetyltransferase [Pseudomonadota bacterium]|nr:GNAT family N-acetyltransferase [Pseudomonadota bacterium]
MSDTIRKLKIRPAIPEDADAIAGMARALSQADGGRASRFSADAFLRDGFGDTAAFQTMVADYNGTAAGYAIYYWGYDTDSATRGVYLADLYVSEARRRAGVGTTLISETARFARADGARWIFWSVLKRNRGARRFYRQLAPELKDVIICAAFGACFDTIADRQTNLRRPD